MMNRITRTGALFLILISGFAATGCNSTMQTERDALWQQNQELQTRLSVASSELEALKRERDELMMQLASLRDQLSRRVVPQQTPVVPQTQTGNTSANTGTGFENIAGVDAVRGKDTITVTVESDILFGPGQATLTSSSRRTLQQVAGVLKSRYRGEIVRVEGHTDSDPIRKSNWRDNQHLSEARAESVRDYLADQGVPRSTLRVIGHGADKPVASNATRDGKAKNRRVEIIVETTR